MRPTLNNMIFLVCLIAFTTISTSASGIIIDTFEGIPQDIERMSPGTTAPPDPDTIRGELFANILGDEREVTLEQMLIGNTSTRFNNAGSSLMAVSAQLGSINKTTVVWDGVGTGLAAVGLNADFSGDDAFFFELPTIQQTTDAVVAVEDNSGNTGESSKLLIKNVTGSFEIPFSDFPGVDFSDVKRITLFINRDEMVENLDIDFNFLNSGRIDPPAIPEPKTFALLSLGLLSFGTVTWRRKRGPNWRQ